MFFKNSFISVKNKLSYTTGIIVALALFIVAAMAFYSSRENLIINSKNANKDYLLVTTAQVETYIESYVEILLSIKKYIDSLPKYQTENFDKLGEYFAKDLKVFKDGSNTLAVYLGFPDGTMLVSDAESDKKGIPFRKRGGGISHYDDPQYNATTRDWYKGALKNKGVFVSDVYEDSVTKFPSFTYSVPIEKNGKLVAVLGIDLLLTSLQKTFEKLPGSVFVFDNTSSIPFASNDKSLILKSYPNIDEIKNHHKIVGDYKTFEYTGVDSGEKRFGVCANINNSNAHVSYVACAIQKQDDLDRLVIEDVFDQIITSIVILILSCFIVYFISSRLLSPLQAIQTGLNSFFDFINHKT
ncbi:methyl-accepting chemotaxis protein, partial [Campylobacter lari]|nr:methyl-accepting chemotaxis protein [Campylobacter lari]